MNFLRALALLFSLITSAEAALSFPVAAGPGKDFDLQGFIDAGLRSGSQRVVVPPGRYRVTPHNAVHLAFKNLHNVEIVADGVEMVCTQTTQAVSFEDCENVHLKGLAIDYDPLPFTEGRITALAPDKSWLEFQLIDGYPDNKLEMRIEIYDPSTGELRREGPNWQPGFTQVAPRRYRVVKAGYKFNPTKDTEQIGDILVTNNVAAPGGSQPHAVASMNCRNLVLDGIWVFASNCFGFLEVGCDNTLYNHCHIERRPPDSDFPQRGFARMRSLDADAYHSISAMKGPSLVGCSAKFQADDCVNIHGVYYLVTASLGPELRVLTGRNFDIEAGDPVEFLPYQGVRPPDGKVLKIEPDAPVTEEEKTFIRRQGFDARLKADLLSARASAFKVTLNEAPDLPMGSLICSGNRVGNGFLVKDCDFGYNRSRGILIKASDGEVVGNKISHTWMASVLVAPEYWWLEAGSGSNLVIKDNFIDGCLGTAIDVQANGGTGKPLAAGAHTNIVISANKVIDSPWPDLSVAATNKLKITGNTFSPPDRPLPAPVRKWEWNSESPASFVTINCEGTDIEGNH